ncbi:golvesin C-terminal-like domain-containing protein [Nannocystis radixulma]|uniref:N-acetylmuramoyl-L-alanine amidase n=1 Tax=Nannocystis radixulma TaxID=2995305 RepID=A0ABT5BGA8_9BACT|nr:N-acetylmuramoyl-L-alanine amidase [Nannocystis radixulma]MDC0672082.1 glycoside hydrolase family 75 protein [Nannocystis radixulma]
MPRPVWTRAIMMIPLIALACESEGGRETADTGDQSIDVPDPVDPPEADPGEYLEGIEGEFIRASEEFGVPVSILKAVAYVESRWEMVEGQVEFEGRDAAFGVMALRTTNQERAADLLGVEADEIRTDRETNIRAAAAVLRNMADAEGIDRDDLGAWAPAIATMAAIGDDAASIGYIHNDVYGLIKNGLLVTDNDGNVISEIEAEPDVEPDYTPTGGPTLVTNPDYAGAIFRSSPNYSSRPATNGKVRLVIIHSCEGAYSGCWGWLVNKDSGVSAHYVVKEDGSEISQLVKEDKKAWHIAATYKKSLNGGQEPQLEGTSSNNFTVGIEHAGFANQAQWNANLIEQSAKLVCDITKRQGVPIDKYHVVAHGQLQPNNRIDPGPNWPWATYFNKINAACGGQPEDPPPEDPDPNEPPPDPQDPEDPPPEDPQDPPPMGQDPAEIIVDSSNGNNDAARAKFTASANWSATAATPGFYGSNYLFASVSPISDAAEFSFYLAAAGSKKIEIWYTSGANRAPDAPVVAFDAQGKNLGTVKVNMQAGGKAWTAVGTFNFTAGWNKIAVSRWTTGNYVVIADAIRVTAAGNNPPPPPPNGDPTAEQLLALTQSCTQLPGTSKFKTDSAGAATIPICQLDGAVWWRADADIDCDGAADPKCTVDPYYQPETSAKDSTGKFMNAAKMAFYVVPLPSNGFDPKAHGIKTGWSGYGSAGAIIYNGKLIYAPYADAGPAGVIGELSYRAAELLGIPPSPINGGVASGVTYIVFTGDKFVDPIESQAAADAIGKQLATQLLADN